jgi:hypothetical protein
MSASKKNIDNPETAQSDKQNWKRWNSLRSGAGLTAKGNRID